MNRQLINDLRTWKDTSDHKPIVLRGARQVGKTTLVRMLGKEFDVFYELNLERKADKDLFDRYDDIHELLRAIYFKFAKTPEKGEKTLLFIDEIQNSPEAVAMLRYFYEDANEIYVITAGSLLESLMEMRQISFPVGRVQYMALRPCSFLEFLDGMGASFDAEAIINIEAHYIHDRLIKRFNEYTLVGGMPEAINQYAINSDIHALKSVYDSLIESYSNDVEKYADTELKVRTIRHILNYGWSAAAETISFEKFGDSAYISRDMGNAFRTLEKAFLLELVYPITDTRLPNNPNFRLRPRLFWLDTGLVNYKAKTQSVVFDTTNITDVWRGRIAEHIVAQELLSLDNIVSANRSFWRRNKKGSEAEVDFIFIYKDLMIPIEVKSGTNSKLKSLHLFMDDAPHSIAIRVWSGNLSVDEVITQQGKVFKLINLPFYYICVIQKMIEKYL
jgi:hypothetical protein